jgi:hypothetical protein
MKRIPVWTRIASVAVLIALGTVVFGGTTTANAQGPAGDGQIRVVRALTVALLGAAEKALNVPQATLRQELGTGKTLAEVIKAHGGDVAAIEASAKTTVTNEIDKAVADGKLTKDQANKLLEKLGPALDKLVNARWPKDRRTRLLEARLKAMGLRIRSWRLRPSNTLQPGCSKERSGKTRHGCHGTWRPGQDRLGSSRHDDRPDQQAGRRKQADSGRGEDVDRRPAGCLYEGDKRAVSTRQTAR